MRDRLFRGFCPADVIGSEAEYDTVYDLFREKQGEIYQMWRNLEGLYEKRLDDTLKYFDEFYTTINDPVCIESKMMKNCRRTGL